MFCALSVSILPAVLTRAGANIDYFGRSAIRHLESLGIKVFNDMAALDISRDKLYTHQVRDTGDVLGCMCMR